MRINDWVNYSTTKVSRLMRRTSVTAINGECRIEVSGRSKLNSRSRPYRHCFSILRYAYLPSKNKIEQKKK